MQRRLLDGLLCVSSPVKSMKGRVALKGRGVEESFGTLGRLIISHIVLGYEPLLLVGGLFEEGGLCL